MSSSTWLRLTCVGGRPAVWLTPIEYSVMTWFRSPKRWMSVTCTTFTMAGDQRSGNADKTLNEI